MAKNKTSYICTNCRATSPKWNGCCLSCNEWGTLEEYTPAPGSLDTLSQAKKSQSSSIKTAQTLDTSRQAPLTKLQDLPSSGSKERLRTNIGEWDRVMGGGIVPGAFIILTGDPGIGKSTLLLSIGATLSRQKKVLYFSSEESLAQIQGRAARVCKENEVGTMLFSDSAELGAIISTVQHERPDVVILDSIQNCQLGDMSALPGTIGQLREAGFLLMKLAKESGCAIIVTGHITKEGQIAGPKVLEHLVDGVFYLQREDRWDLRILRAVKNRFGTINEIGFFKMGTDGLTQISNINQHFLEEHAALPGAALTCLLEGTRPLLIELQALCVTTKYNLPQRVITGLDPKRVLLIAALLEKYLQIKLSAFDIFFKVSGGCTIKESASDLAIALALLSSYFQQPLPEKALALGEISLTGQIKQVPYLEQRISEADKFGISHIYAPQLRKKIVSKTAITPIGHIYHLLKLFPEK